MDFTFKDTKQFIDFTFQDKNPAQNQCIDFTFQGFNQNNTCGDEDKDEVVLVDEKYFKANNSIPLFFPKAEKIKVIEAKKGSELKIQCGDSLYIGQYDTSRKLSKNWIFESTEGTRINLIFHKEITIGGKRFTDALVEKAIFLQTLGDVKLASIVLRRSESQYKGELKEGIPHGYGTITEGEKEMTGTFKEHPNSRYNKIFAEDYDSYKKNKTQQKYQQYQHPDSFIVSNLDISSLTGDDKKNGEQEKELQDKKRDELDKLKHNSNSGKDVKKDLLNYFYR